MKINLITHDNGVGLTQDVKILKDAIPHECKFVEVFDKVRPPTADINLFLEIVKPEWYKRAGKNYFMPNPEWYLQGWQALANIDLILCKTLDALKIFAPHHASVYTSFTSVDRFTNVNRIKQFLHLAGQSETKGTEAVVSIWDESMPPLVMMKMKGLMMQPLKNVVRYDQRVDDETLLKIMNSCLFHLCPSQYEGFGHYLWEAKSCGNIVITTDGEPMSDFVTDGVDGFLAKVKSKKKLRLANAYLVDPVDLKRVVRKCQALTDEKITQMRTASRRAWEGNDAFFRQMMKGIFQ